MTRWARAAAALLALGLAVNVAGPCCGARVLQEPPCCPGSDAEPAASLRAAPPDCCAAPNDTAYAALLVRFDVMHPTLLPVPPPALPGGAPPGDQPARALVKPACSSSPQTTILRI